MERDQCLRSGNHQNGVGASCGTVAKNSPASTGNTGDMGLIPGLGRSLEGEMATHSSILAWKIPWTEEPGHLQSIGLQRVGHNCYWALTHVRNSISNIKKQQMWLGRAKEALEEMKVPLGHMAVPLTLTRYGHPHKAYSTQLQTYHYEKHGKPSKENRKKMIRPHAKAEVRKLLWSQRSRWEQEQAFEGQQCSWWS